MLATLPEEQQGGLVAAEIGVNTWLHHLHTYPLHYTNMMWPVSSMLILLREAAVSAVLTHEMFQAVLQQLAQAPGDTAPIAEWDFICEVRLSVWHASASGL
jgi:hypothetical protein